MTFETLAFINNLLYNANEKAHQAYKEALNELHDLEETFYGSKKAPPVREQQSVVDDLWSEYCKVNRAYVEFTQKEWR